MGGKNILEQKHALGNEKNGFRNENIRGKRYRKKGRESCQNGQHQINRNLRKYMEGGGRACEGVEATETGQLRSC